MTRTEPVETYCQRCGFTYAASFQADAQRESCGATGYAEPHQLVEVVARPSKAAVAARAKLTARELDALRVELRRELRAETRPVRTPRVRETPEVAAAAVRMTRAVAARAAVDVDQLPALVAIRDAVDAQLVEAVRAARDPQLNAVPWSWADVGRVLGITKQAAQQRFGKAETA